MENMNEKGKYVCALATQSNIQIEKVTDKCARIQWNSEKTYCVSKPPAAEAPSNC